MLHASRLTLHLSLFLFLLAVYLFTYTPRINASDGLAMFATAESLVRRGALDIEQIRWMDLQQGTYGLDGRLYSRKGIGVPIGLLPLTWLGLVVPWWGAAGASLLFNALVTALTAALLLAYLQQLGYSQQVSLIVALLFGLTTLAWPYAKSLFSDPFSGLLLLAAAYALLKFHASINSRGAEDHPPSRGTGEGRGEKIISPAPLPPRSPALFYPFLAGLFLAWNVATRYAEAIFVPVYGLLLLYYLYQVKRSNVQTFKRINLLTLTAFAIPLFAIGLALIVFNLSRYGDLFNTGYLPNETFSGSLWQGILGQLVSPGRGLLLYSPIFILSLVGLPAFYRRYRPEALLGLSIILIHLLLYGKWFMWHGGYAWGPRFLIPTLPFWALFLAPVVQRVRGEEDAMGRRRADATASSPHRLIASTPLRLILLILAAIGFAVQLLLVTIDFAPFQNSLLDTGLPLFDPQTFFNPQYAPLIAAWPFVTRNALDLAWAWQGNINGWLLVVLLANLVITGLNLLGQMTKRFTIYDLCPDKGYLRFTNGLLRFMFPRPLTPLLALLSTLVTIVWLLAYVHILPPLPLQQAVTALNAGVRPVDAVIANTPEQTMPFAELYKGRAPVLGLNSGGFPLPGDITRRLEETIAAHPQVWWLPNNLPPEQSAVELTLAADGFRARNDTFEGQRLALFAFSSNLPPQTGEAVFENQIKLVEAAYPPKIPAGVALPLELRWQTPDKLTENYHVFVHLVDETGQRLAQSDGQPALWTRPTTTWAAGETIVDRHGLWLPAGLPSGTYQLRVGLYRPADGQPLSLTTGQGWVQFILQVE